MKPLYSRLGDVFVQEKTVKRFTVDRICGDLEEHGYAVQPLAIPAIAVDAPHVRERVWFLAKRRVADTVRVGEQDGNRFYDFFKGGISCATTEGGL